MSRGEDGATLRYSLDGGEPDTDWTGPLTVTGTTLLRLQQVSADGAPQEVLTHSYLFPAEALDDPNMSPAYVNDPELAGIILDSLRSLPAVSLVMSGEPSTVEQAVSFEWLPADAEAVHADCGVAEVGNHSLNYEKTNLRLYFRESYGLGRLEASLFEGFESGLEPATSHDALNLRSGSHDSVNYLGSRGQHLRNRWMDESQLAMGHVAPHGRPVHVWVNGRYRGMHQLRERFNAAMLSEYLGGSEDDYEAVNGGRVIDGDGEVWATVKALGGDYEAIQDWVDVQNFVDYMLLNFYSANSWDWLDYHNWVGAGPITPSSGGYRFHSSDSDICLYYDVSTNILDLPGPSAVFKALVEEAHPDFMMLLSDRTAALFEGEGPLSAEASAQRYARIADDVEDAIVAEAARWGQGWWRHDSHWAVERDHLLYDWFPYRTARMLEQLRGAGWYALGLPELEGPTEGALRVSVPDGLSATLLLRTDGGDPRLPGGELAPEGVPARAGLDVLASPGLQLRARLYQSGTWGPLLSLDLPADDSPPVILNEWNAVAPDEQLEDGDDALGHVDGNGGDWLELLVLRDVDLRGWVLRMADVRGDLGELVLPEHAELAGLRPGTLITISEDLLQDLSVSPAEGDWRMHLTAEQPFDVTHLGWQLTLIDPDGRVRFGPVGEGVGAVSGLSSSEVGLLAATPGARITGEDPGYRDGDRSTYGAPNRWGDQVQDLRGLRGELPGVIDLDRDYPEPEDSEVPEEPSEPAPGGCGAPLAPSLPLALFSLALLARRRGALTAALVLGVGCAEEPTATDKADSAPAAEDTAPAPSCYEDLDGDGYGDPASPLDCAWGVTNDEDCDDLDAAVHPRAGERCDGVDNDCDGAIDDADDDVVDGLPFYQDADGDGYGDSEVVISACRAGEGASAVGGDCDDAEPSWHPNAEEQCDGVDRDCDGEVGSVPGASATCAVDSCLALFELAPETADGAYWLRLHDGGAAPVWCDMSRGGWTLGFLRNTVSTGSQGDFGAGDRSPESLGVSPDAASASTSAHLGWVDLNLLAWDELELSAHKDGAETWRSAPVPRAELRLSFGEPGYLLYGGSTGYYWCGGPASYTDDGVGAVDNPQGATLDCKGHGSLGSGWDFSAATTGNLGLTLCGGDGSSVANVTWAGAWIYYGTPGGAQALWVR